MNTVLDLHGYDRKVETIVDSMSRLVKCDDVSPHSSDFIVVRAFLKHDLTV